MSELINTHDNRATIRWKLLTGASALALAAYVSAGSVAKAEDTDHPLIWIELSGQAAWNESGQEAFLPPFLLSTPRPPFETESPQKVERAARVSWDESAQISFEPAGSKWVLSAGIRYGRSGRHQYLDQLTQQFDTAQYGVLAAYQNITSRNSESHAVLDFRAGRDVGLGQFGSNGTSVINAGVRFVQFNAKSNIAIQSQPTNAGFFYHYHKFNAHFLAARKFSGVGPSLSWDASAAIAGNSGDGKIGIDWGINAALLFGRQTVRGHHQTTDVGYLPYPTSINHYSAPLSRSKRVTVPNLGGYAALSWRYEDAKVSFGYRADMFFNAVDGGIDTAKKENRAFYGPYASISIGLGD
jgi:hypothetical protein